MTPPLISIIVPVYNAENYLRRGLDSLLSQSDTRWEALCINDGSSDNSGALLDEYAEKDSRIRVFHQKNQGVSVARNRGIAEADGEFVTFLDADDRFADDLVAGLIQHGENQETDIILFDTELEYEPGTERNLTLENNLKLKGKGLMPGGPGCINMSVGSCCGKAYRRSFLHRFQLQFPLGMRHEDEVFYRCCMAAARWIDLVPQTGYYYLQTASSFMHSGQSAKDTYLLYVKGMGLVHEFYRQHGCLPAWEESILDFLFHFMISKAHRVTPQEMRAMRQGTAEFLQRTDIPGHFRNDYRLRYISVKSPLRDFFIRRCPDGEMYGCGRLGLIKIRYRDGRYERCITPIHKVIDLLLRRKD